MNNQSKIIKCTFLADQFIQILSLSSRFILLLGLTIAIACTQPAKTNKPHSRPNILLLVADDLGYADLGCYGGDINTPTIDKLAEEGIRFSRFHTSPLCAPTRAMLLSGNDNHIAGMGRQSRRTTEFGYEGHISNRVAIIPEVLKAAGYHTYIAGKWHLGKDPDSDPHARGFERSFVNLRGGGNHYNGKGLFKEDPMTPYTEDGVKTTWTKGAYSTNFYTDKLIEYIDSNHKDGHPFFAFAAYTSPHWPLQVDSSYWMKYKGRYNAGYEILRKKRLESLKRVGMIPDDAVLPTLYPGVKPWNSLSSEEQKKESRKMELYAGMVDNLDMNIGRILKHLKDIGEYENTFIVFIADNGAAAEDFFYDKEYGPFLHTQFNDDYNHMGDPSSFISYGPPWAEAGSSPFRYFKGYTTEGGINTPMIIHGPGVKGWGAIDDQFVTLMDLAPTFYELAETDYPDSLNGHPVYPLRGSSLLPMLSGKDQRIHSNEYVFGLEHGERTMVRKGEWKLVSSHRPFDSSELELYHVAIDLAERHNLKESEPEKYREMKKEWLQFVEEMHVRFPTPKAQ